MSFYEIVYIDSTVETNQEFFYFVARLPRLLFATKLQRSKKKKTRMKGFIMFQTDHKMF